ncbi:MAG: tetratricopeptide repeat protein [Betaproteobacteria bacterium]|nr:tetratricopeptide repeat protein [Betaproteobacteria bacterium]
MMFTGTQRKLATAFELFQRGRLSEADLLAKQVLVLDPRTAEALHLRGVVAGLQQRHSDAEGFLLAAASLDKRNHFIHFNLAKALSEQGKNRDSLPWHRKAIELDPGREEAWLGYGLSLKELGELTAAIEAFDRALAINSRLTKAYTNKGNCLQEMGALDEALTLHNRAVELSPTLAEAWSNRGVALNDLRRHAEALASYERAIELKPDDAKAWSNRGVALNDLRRHAEALASYERAIELQPDYAKAWSNRGVALSDLRRHDEALASCEQAIGLKPGYAEAWSNRGVALNDLRRHEEALASYERAIELKSNYAEAWSNRGVALNDLRRHEEALASYERAIELKPDYAEAIYSKGLLQLSHKEFLGGFENYLWRWKTRSFSSPALMTDLPLCDRTKGGESLLLWAEQGIGDEIFYAGLLAQALERFSSIRLVADRRLHLTLSRSFPTITLFERGQTLKPESLKGMDSQAPIGNLAYVLGLDSEAILSTRGPFLVADRERRDELRLLAPFSNGKTICGLAWKSHNKDFGEEKSIGLEQLEPILTNTRLEFVNLQYGDVDADIQKVRDRFDVKIHQIKGVDAHNDIDGLLALIDACDIVVTTSNVTAHLAGSIGRRGCVFVPLAKGRIWYWHPGDVDSFWYPGLKVFHQRDMRDWTDTIRQATTWIDREVL